MKAVQIDRCSKDWNPVVRDVPTPSVGETDMLVKVAAAAVNPVDVMNMDGSVRPIQNLPLPCTLGNELSGTVERTGAAVEGFLPGDAVMARLPLSRIGAFAEYAAVDFRALAKIPEGWPLDTAAALPLAGLTAYQGFVEELEAKAGQTVLITGASGTFGQVAVPLAKAFGLDVVATGNARSKDRVLALGADRYLDYRAENYWEELEGVDHVVDTLGAAEFERELSVLKPGGRLLSLRTGPNATFAERTGAGALKRLLYTLASAKYDKAARREGKEYRFLFVRADGCQLREVARVAEERGIVPRVDGRAFGLDDAKEALTLVARGQANGKILLRP